MAIPVTEYFRILVIGDESGIVSRVIEEDLNFETKAVPSDQAAEAIRAGHQVRSSFGTPIAKIAFRILVC